MGFGYVAWHSIEKMRAIKLVNATVELYKVSFFDKNSPCIFSLLSISKNSYRKVYTGVADSL